MCVCEPGVGVGRLVLYFISVINTRPKNLQQIYDVMAIYNVFAFVNLLKEAPWARQVYILQHLQNR